MYTAFIIGCLSLLIFTVIVMTAEYKAAGRRCACVQGSISRWCRSRSFTLSTSVTTSRWNVVSTPSATVCSTTRCYGANSKWTSTHRSTFSAASTSRLFRPIATWSRSTPPSRDISFNYTYQVTTHGQFCSHLRHRFNSVQLNSTVELSWNELRCVVGVKWPLRLPLLYTEADLGMCSMFNR